MIIAVAWDFQEEVLWGRGFGGNIMRNWVYEV